MLLLIINNVEKLRKYVGTKMLMLSNSTIDLQLSGRTVSHKQQSNSASIKMLPFASFYMHSNNTYMHSYNVLTLVQILSVAVPTHSFELNVQHLLQNCHNNISCDTTDIE